MSKSKNKTIQATAVPTVAPDAAVPTVAPTTAVPTFAPEVVPPVEPTVEPTVEVRPLTLDDKRAAADADKAKARKASLKVFQEGFTNG